MTIAGLACFKAYDIRGRVPDELNNPLAEKIGRAFAEVAAERGARTATGEAGPEVDASRGGGASGVAGPGYEGQATRSDASPPSDPEPSP